MELFKILGDDAVKVLHSICQQIWKPQQWPQDWKRSVFIPIPKKGNFKEFSNYHTIALISHASKVMLKILQVRMQQYMLGVNSLGTPQRKWASSRLEGRTSWMFSGCGGCSTYDGDHRDPLWWPQEKPVPMRVARGPLGISLPLTQGPKTLCGVGAGS